jgi:hypothetical protein
VHGDTDPLGASGLDIPREQEKSVIRRTEVVTMHKSLRCMLGRHHWVRLRAEGEVFVRCSRCRKRDFQHYYDGEKAKRIFEQPL